MLELKIPASYRMGRSLTAFSEAAARLADACSMAVEMSTGLLLAISVLPGGQTVGQQLADQAQLLAGRHRLTAAAFMRQWESWIWAGLRPEHLLDVVRRLRSAERELRSERRRRVARAAIWKGKRRRPNPPSRRQRKRIDILERRAKRAGGVYDRLFAEYDPSMRRFWTNFSTSLSNLSNGDGRFVAKFVAADESHRDQLIASGILPCAIEIQPPPREKT